MPDTIRLAISGGNRGFALARAAAAQDGRYNIVAAFDPAPQAMDKWRDLFPSIATHTSYDALLADRCDAVLVAGPMQVHAEQSIAALQAGKHVLSEVPACVTHDEALALIDATKRSGRVYMMAENVCYLREHLVLLEMINRGAFGELTYAEGGYIHEVRPMAFNDDGSLTWRGELHHRMAPAGVTYPTHSIGPIAWWLGLNQTDKLATVYCITSPPAGMVDYTRKRFGDAHPGSNAQYWGHGDTSHALIHTQRGRVIHLRMDLCSNRPNHNFTHELQGTRGVYKTHPDIDQSPLVWLDGISPYENHERVWEPISKHAADFEHPLWQAHGQTAAQTGHYGADYFVMQQFAAAVRGDIASPIDVIDAVTWSSLVWLTRQSEAKRAPVKATDYTTAV
jgi:predicted dehydrogenase